MHLEASSAQMTWDLAVCARVATSTIFTLVFKGEKEEFVTGRLVCSSEMCFLALLSSLPRVEDVISFPNQNLFI